MTTYDYIQTVITPDRFQDMVRVGLIPFQTLLHMQIYEWHIANGRSQHKTSEHFRIPLSSVGYAVSKMTKPI